MAIAAKDVMNLRKMTGLGMMECKQALTEAEGDVKRAQETLREKGLAKMDGRADRDSSEGRIAIAIADGKSKAAIVRINTETDFTAKNDQFVALVQGIADQALDLSAGQVDKTDRMQAAIDELRLTTKENIQFNQGVVFGGSGSRVGSYLHFTAKTGALVEVEGENVTDELLADLCMHVVAISPEPIGVNDDDVPEELLAKEREIAKAQAIESGKPAQIVEKIVAGKIRKFYEEHVLTKQKFVKDDKKTIASLLPEGAKIKNFVKFTVGA